MTIDAQQKKLLIEELTIGLPAAAWTLRSERRKFSAHLLRVACMRHVYETLSEVAENLDILNVTLIDLFLTEGIEMDEKTKEMEQQIGRQAAHPAAAHDAEVPAARETDQTSAEATNRAAQEARKRTDPTCDMPESAADSIEAARALLAQEQEKQFELLAAQLACAITGSYGKAARENRRVLLEAMPAAIGMRNVVVQLDRLQEKLVAALKQLDLIEVKFTGIGKAIGIIAQATQKNMAGNSGELDDNEQGD